MQINYGEKEFIKHFGLNFSESKGKAFLKGELVFSASYDRRSRKYTFYKPSHAPSNDKYFIKDSYFIEIDLSSDNVYRSVRETGGKINKMAEEMGLPLDKLHKFPTGELCLVGYFNEKKDIGFREFFSKVVVPFFFDQSFFFKFRKWPRGQYSHACLGILENYYEEIISHDGGAIDRNLTEKCILFLNQIAQSNQNNHFGFNSIKKLLNKKKIKPHWNCIGCSEQKKFPWLEPGSRSYRKPKVSHFKVCHQKAFLGIRLLHKNIRKFKLKNKFITTKKYEFNWPIQYIRKIAPRHFNFLTVFCSVLFLP